MHSKTCPETFRTHSDHISGGFSALKPHLLWFEGEENPCQDGPNVFKRKLNGKGAPLSFDPMRPCRQHRRGYGSSVDVCGGSRGRRFRRLSFLSRGYRHGCHTGFQRETGRSNGAGAVGAMHASMLQCNNPRLRGKGRKGCMLSTNMPPWNLRATPRGYFAGQKKLLGCPQEH